MEKEKEEKKEEAEEEGKVWFLSMFLQCNWLIELLKCD